VYCDVHAYVPHSSGPAECYAMGGAQTSCILSWLIAMQFSCLELLKALRSHIYSIHIRQCCGCGTLVKGSAKGIVCRWDMPTCVYTLF
jgi:hypothetical protein